MSVIKDYLGHEIHKGDIVLYNEKGCNGHHSSFSEGIAIEAKGKVVVLNIDYITEYHDIIEYYNKWNHYPYWHYVNTKLSKNVINLSTLGIRENRIKEIE